MPAVKIPGTCYLVGGAVRDELLGLEVKDRDWVVVGATEREMVDARFLQVGKHFPVFLHPKTHEEYALARIETKSGPGHRGFSVQSDSEISLIEDLKRRDLTINSIAKDQNGNLIDPFGGLADIKSKTLRHVSDAFTEDPLRCFRVARFAAQFPDFHLHDTTLRLIASMGDQLCELSSERVWNEWVRALDKQAPGCFYAVIQEAGIHEPWFKHLDLQLLTQKHTNLTLNRPGCFALMGWLHDASEIEKQLDLIGAPNKVRRLVSDVANLGKDFESLNQLESEAILNLFEKSLALRRDPHFETFIEALAQISSVDLALIRELREALSAVKGQGKPGPEIGRQIKQRRLQVIDSVLHNRS